MQQAATAAQQRQQGAGNAVQGAGTEQPSVQGSKREATVEALTSIIKLKEVDHQMILS